MSGSGKEWRSSNSLAVREFSGKKRGKKSAFVYSICFLFIKKLNLSPLFPESSVQGRRMIVITMKKIILIIIIMGRSLWTETCLNF